MLASTLVLSSARPHEHHGCSGCIQADGGEAKRVPSDGSDSQPGGGSGGTILLQIRELKGNADINAIGGTGASGSTGAGGGGGGGFVALQFIEGDDSRQMKLGASGAGRL